MGDETRPQLEKKLSVTIVEPDDDGRALLSEGLAGAGYAAEGAKTGKEGIFKALERCPDVFLLNPHLLAALDGFKLIKMIKTIDPMRRSLLMVMLDEAEKEEILRAVQAGADSCISKDISVHHIHMKIRQSLKQKRPDPAPLYENLRYAASGKDGLLTLGIESDLNSATGKDLVQLGRVLIPLHPLTLVLSLEKVPAIAIGVVGYLSDLKDMAKDCGGNFSLSQFNSSKYPANIQRVLTTNFQIQ